MAFLLVCAVLSWRTLCLGLQENAQRKLDAKADLMAGAIQSALDVSTQPLYGIDGLFQADPRVGRTAFNAFLAAQNLQKIRADIFTLGYAERVKPEAVAAFTQGIRADGFPKFAIMPKNASGELYVTKFGYMSDGENFPPPSGFDLASDPTRFAAIGAARDSGALAVTAPLILRTGTGARRGFIVYLPVYAPGKPNSTREERRANLLGVAGVGFKADVFFRGVLEHTSAPPDLRVYVYDAAVSTLGGDDLYLRAANVDLARHLSSEREIRFADRTWRLDLEASEDFGKSQLERAAPPFFLIRNILLAIFLPVFLYVLLRLRERKS